MGSYGMRRLGARRLGTGRLDSAMVQVVFLKYDGRPHRSYPARWLGEDSDGTWLGVTAGTVARVDGDREAIREEPYVLLVPKWAWWTAMFNAPPRPTEIYCDVTTPATWSGTNEVTVVDLDLDVRRRRWGDIERLDDDEFAEHQVRFGYPDEVITQATAASYWLATALGDGTEPFASGFRPWLAQVSET
jgi:protein associated with RNAse G/E